jgi:uncharacterized protein DUF4239
VLHWLSGLPVAISLPLVVIVGCLYSVGGFLIWRRIYNPNGAREPTDGAPFAALAGAAAVFLFGFTIITMGAEFRTTRSQVSREANLLMTLHEDFASYPAAIRSRLDAALANYVREIVEREFPALASGERPRPDDAAAIRLRTEVLAGSLPALDPRMQGAIVQHFLEVDDLRHERLARGGTAMTMSLWIALIATSLISLTASWLVVLRRLDTQVGLIALLATAYAVLFFVVVQLDYPFTGPTAIGAQPFLDALTLTSPRP